MKHTDDGHSHEEMEGELDGMVAELDKHPTEGG